MLSAKNLHPLKLNVKLHMILFRAA